MLNYFTQKQESYLSNTSSIYNLFKGVVRQCFLQHKDQFHRLFINEQADKNTCISASVILQSLVEKEIKAPTLYITKRLWQLGLGKIPRYRMDFNFDTFDRTLNLLIIPF